MQNIHALLEEKNKRPLNPYYPEVNIVIYLFICFVFLIK